MFAEAVMRPVKNYSLETISLFVVSKSWGVLPLGQGSEAAPLQAPSMSVMKLVYRLFVFLTNPRTRALVFCFVCLPDELPTSVRAQKGAVQSLLAAKRL